MERNYEGQKIPYKEMTPKQQYKRLSSAWTTAMSLRYKTNSPVDVERYDRLRDLLHNHPYRPIWEAEVAEIEKDPNSLTNKIRAFTQSTEGSESDRAFLRLYADPLFGYMAAVIVHGDAASSEKIEETAQRWQDTFNKAADEIQ